MGLKAGGVRGSLRNLSTGVGIPDSVVNRLLLDEGSGTSVSDSVGSADGTLNNDGVWTDDSGFRGGTAPFFDATDDWGSWQPRTTAPITWTCRIRAADPLNSDTDNGVWGHGVGPALAYDSGNDEWTAYDQAIDTAIVSDSQGTVEGSDRIIAVRLDNSTLALDVYESDASAKVGSDTLSSPSTSFDGASMYLGDYDPTGSPRPFGDNVDLIDVHNEYVSNIDSLVSQVYG